jgi:hypothetical protein
MNETSSLVFAMVGIFATYIVAVLIITVRAVGWRDALTIIGFTVAIVAASVALVLFWFWAFGLFA